MTPGIERDELVARLADLYVSEDAARHKLCGLARMSDSDARRRWLLEAANALRAAIDARTAFRDALPRDHDTAIGVEAVRLAEELARDRADRRYGWGKHAKAASSEARP